MIFATKTRHMMTIIQEVEIMWNMLWTMVNWSWKVLGLAGAWMLFKYIVRDGKDTIADILETLSMGLQAICLKAKRKLWEVIKKESKGPVTTEGSVK